MMKAERKNAKKEELMYCINVVSFDMILLMCCVCYVVGRTKEEREKVFIYIFP